ncbi:MAG: glutathione S-transferase family protein [Rhizobiaceae bacterium]|nr:glutathione S-transferase family protein [Rhizobiaceae bacterium]
MLELYHNAMSVCAQKVRLALAEKGLEWTSHHMNLRNKEQFSEAYLALNPNGVVPTLVHDGEPIIESTIINEFIDDAFAGAPLRPEDPVRRAHMRYWTRQLDDTIHAATSVVTLSIAIRHQFLELHDEKAIEELLAAVPNAKRRASKRFGIEKGMDHPELQSSLLRLEKMLDNMEDALRTARWLAGPDFSLADIGLVPYVLRLDHLGLGNLTIERRPNVCRWLDAMRSRKSYEEAILGRWDDQAYVANLKEKGAQAREAILLRMLSR